MLSLYDKNFKLPELLPKFNKLFIEKMQSPLALLPPTADDDTVNFKKCRIQNMQSVFTLDEYVTNVENDLIFFKPRGLTPIGGISSERSGLGLNANSSSGSALGGISNGMYRNSDKKFFFYGFFINLN